MRQFLKIFFKLGFIVSIVAATLYGSNLDISKATQILLKMKLSTCGMIVLAFAANFYLAALRNQLAYQQFRIPMSFPALQLGLLSGILGGIFPIFGSAISQSLILNKSSGLKHSTSVLLYFYDKIIMAFAGLLLTCGALLFLVQDWTFIQQLAIQHEGCFLLEFIFTLTLCVSFVFLYVLPKSNRLSLFNLINLRSTLYVVAALILSFAIWIISTSCFVQCIKDFYVDDFANFSYHKIFAACSIISFLASLPISVNGWGVREFAAISILTFLLIPAEVALSAAIAVGILSTLSILILFVFHFTYAYKINGGSVATTQK